MLQKHTFCRKTKAIKCISRFCHERFIALLRNIVIIFYQWLPLQWYHFQSISLRPQFHRFFWGRGVGSGTPTKSLKLWSWADWLKITTISSIFFGSPKLKANAVEVREKEKCLLCSCGLNTHVPHIKYVSFKIHISK